MKYIDAEFLANIYVEKIDYLINEANYHGKPYFDLHYSLTQDLKAPYIDFVFTEDELSRLTPYIWRNIIASEATFMALREIDKSDEGITAGFLKNNILRIMLPEPQRKDYLNDFLWSDL